MKTCWRKRLCWHKGQQPSTLPSQWYNSLAGSSVSLVLWSLCNRTTQEFARRWEKHLVKSLSTSYSGQRCDLSDGKCWCGLNCWCKRKEETWEKCVGLKGFYYNVPYRPCRWINRAKCLPITVDKHTWIGYAKEFLMKWDAAPGSTITMTQQVS